MPCPAACCRRGLHMPPRMLPARSTVLPSPLQLQASKWFQALIMMEEYLEGPEVDVDLVLCGGQAVGGWVWVGGRAGGRASGGEMA